MKTLTKKLLGAHPQGFNSFKILGRRGVGKSTYALLCLHDYFVCQGETNNNAWRKALDCLYFTIPEIVSFLEECVDKGIKRPCLIWDDARSQGQGGLWHLNMRLCIELGGLLDVVRSCVSNLILTAPSTQGMLKMLKSYDDYEIRITWDPKGSYYRIATGYLWNTIPSGTRLIYKKFKDPYNCRIPNFIYNQYLVKRDTAVKDLLRSLKKHKDLEPVKE